MGAIARLPAPPAGGGSSGEVPAPPAADRQTSDYDAASTPSEVFFCFDSFICNPLHEARRAMAAAPSCSSRPQLNYPPVYPFPTPGPACAVIVGVSPRSPSPHIRQTKKRKQKTPNQPKQTVQPRAAPPARGPNSTWPPSPSSIAGGLRSRVLARSPGHSLSL